MHLCDPKQCKNHKCVSMVQTGDKPPPDAASSRSMDVWVVVVKDKEGTLLIKCPHSPLVYATPVIQENLKDFAQLSEILNDAAQKNIFLWMILMGSPEDTRHFREVLVPSADKRVLAEINYMVRDMKLETIREKLKEISVF